jgi:hypothetical protein
MPTNGFECHLRRVPAPRPEYEYGHYAELTFVNVGTEAVSFTYLNAVVELFDFSIADESGAELVVVNLGGLYISGRTRERTLTISPQEQHTEHLYLLACIPEHLRDRGKCSIRASIARHGIQAFSETVAVEVGWSEEILGD